MEWRLRGVLAALRQAEVRTVLPAALVRMPQVREAAAVAVVLAVPAATAPPASVGLAALH